MARRGRLGEAGHRKASRGGANHGRRAFVGRPAPSPVLAALFFGFGYTALKLPETSVRIFIAAIVALLLSGCATVSTVQAQCDKTNTSFAEVVQCVDATVKADARLSRNPSANLYVLRGYQLNERLERRQISEIDARVELQQLAVQIKAENDAAVHRSIANIPKPAPVLRSTCTTYAGITTCRTQ